MDPLASLLLRALGCVFLVIALTLRYEADEMRPEPRKWCIRVYYSLVALSGALVFNDLWL